MRLHRKVPPLHGSDSSFDDAQADLPLRDDGPVPPVTPQYLGSALSDPVQTSLPRSHGMVMWLVAAGALVAGILIGFVSGYNAARGANAALPPAFVSGGEPPSIEQTSAPVADAQTFTEDAVTEPVRVDPEPIVTAAGSEDPAPQATTSGAGPSGPALSAPAAPPSAVPVPSGPGSVHVLSRPSGAQVVIDGRVAGRTPLVVPDVGPGRHDVRIELPGFRQWATSVQVAPGERTRVAASLEQ